MDDEWLLRFNRQIMLPQIDVAGQQTLNDSHIAVIGLGGLGCPAAMYLAAAGIGRLTLIDHDHVELTNLQRQLAYTDQDVGQSKVSVMKALLARLNPACQVTTVEQAFDPGTQNQILADADVIVDATDTTESRNQVNAFAVEQRIPLVFRAAIRMEGQLSVFDSRLPSSPCYACVFGDTRIDETCSQSGILGTVVGTLGLMQATEAIKLVLGIGDSGVGRLQLYDALGNEWRSIKISKRADCPVCG